MDLKKTISWDQQKDIASKRYTCSYCGNDIAANRGFAGLNRASGKVWSTIYICHFCSRPTFFDPDGGQYPGASIGGEVNNIDDHDVRDLYREARDAAGANCHTAAVLCCRKLLMHIAVAKGAKTNQSFASYVDYLNEQHLIPPDAKIWVDHIRKQGNEANHEISIIKGDTAKELLSFTEMLLKIIFEFPATAKKKYADPERKEDV